MRLRRRHPGTRRSRPVTWPTPDAGLSECGVVDTGSGIPSRKLAGERTRTLNALTALLHVADLGIDVLARTTAHVENIRLAKRIIELDGSLAKKMARIAEFVEANPAADFLESAPSQP